MSINYCLLGKVERDKVSQEEYNDLIKVYREFEARNALTMGPTEAATVAGQQLIEAADRAAARKLRIANLKIIAADRITTQMAAHPKGLMTGALSHLVRDINDAAPHQNIDSLHRQTLGLLHARWFDGIKALKPGFVGLARKKTLQRTVLRELFGEDTGDAIGQQVSKSWKETAEYARARFNKAGGDIAKRDDWGLPQGHSMRDVAAVSRDQWKEFILPLLDRQKMRNATTEIPFNDQELDFLLDQTYDRIVSDGLVDLEPGGAGKGSMLANRHQDHRFLSFKDADSWLAYQNRFGNGDVYSVMTHHLDVMAKDIAVLEVLGPNPDAMMRYMQDIVKKAAATSGDSIPKSSLKLFEDIYALQTHRASAPVSVAFAGIMGGVRNILTSAQLGAAALSATTDIGFQKIARRMNGLPVMNILSGYLKQMNPASAADRDLAVQLGLVAENATSMALAQRRYFGETMGPSITRTFADVTLRASLLSSWTEAGRHAFGMEFLGLVTRSADTAFADLPDKLRGAMTRYGIDETDWNVIRRAERVTHKGGAKFISPVRLAEKDLTRAGKLQRMILTETDFAVPSLDTRTRAITSQGTRPGTLVGELMRSVAMYKSFPVTVILTHIMRGLNRPTRGSAGIYLANMFITMTVLGALAYQLKQVAKGKDPMTMDPDSEEGRKFWMAAMAQGGGVGIFGDYLFSDVNRMGSSPAMTFAGPVAGFVDDSIRLSIGNVQETIKGDETNAGREVVKYAGRYTPGSSLWYSRLAFERLVLDQLQMQADPRARESFNATENTMRREYKQKYWWRPGKTEPSRPPEMPN